MDFSKFDFSKMFDMTTAIDTVEKTVKTNTTYLPEQVREQVQSINTASFSLARTTAQSFADYMDVIQSVAKDASTEMTKAVRKSSKASA